MGTIVYSVLALLIAGLCYVVYDEVASEKIYIRKDQWTCTVSHTNYILVNKILTPYTVCDNYRRTNKLEN